MSERQLKLGADKGLKLLEVAAKQYEREFEKSRVEYFRADEFTLHIRVTDPRFSKINFFARLNVLRGYFKPILPKSIMKQVVLLLGYTPREVKTKFGSIELDELREAS